MPDGGWVTTHEDITELKATHAVANERISLQALIDWLPDNLWVKDVDGRFVISNQATGDPHRRAGSRGPLRQNRSRTPFPGDREEVFRRRTGDRPLRQPIIDIEEIRLRRLGWQDNGY